MKIDIWDTDELEKLWDDPEFQELMKRNQIRLLSKEHPK